MAKGRVFVWVGSEWSSGDIVSYGMAEDGTALASHLSSNESWAKHDMGVTSDWKHDLYRAHYPDGFEVVWLGKDCESSPEFVAAYERYKAAQESEDRNG